MRRRYVFAGRVQGVGFRATARQIAGSFAVTGWVRNEPDGSVMLEAQGDPAEVDRFIAQLSQTLARNITRTTTLDLTDLPSEQSFQITR